MTIPVQGIDPLPCLRQPGRMRITTNTRIDALPADVWRVVGPGFAHASRWASSTSTSVGVGLPSLANAPCSARQCKVTAPGAERLVEELIAYDADATTLTYAVTSGMDRVARATRVTWTVIGREVKESELRIEMDLDLSPLGRAIGPILRRYLARASRRNGDDLRVFIETGRPGRRKQRQQAVVSSLTRAIAWNAAFTSFCGVMLIGAAEWWAQQFSDVAVAVMSLLGVGLLAYGMTLTWLAVRGSSATIGRLLAVLDAAWVIGVVVLVAYAGDTFTWVGATAALLSSAAVAAFGLLQWRLVAGVLPRQPS